MQNASSYSNPPHAPQSHNQPLQYLQRHVSQLTAYINENNQKYHKNMVTLKQFYEQQAQELHDHNQELLQENSKVNNEIVTVRDILGNVNIKNRQLEQLLAESERREKEGREKIEEERRRNELMYNEMETMRKNKQKVVEQLKGRIDQLEEQNRRLTGQLFSRETNIEALNKNVQSLSSKVNQSYLLPNKIDDLQKGQFEYQTKMKELHLNNQSLQQQLNSTNLTITKLQSENESLKIFKANHTTEKKLQIQKVIKQQKQATETTINRLQTEKHNYLYQLNQLESRVKVGQREREQLQEQLLKQKEQADKFEIQVRQVSQQKAEYVSQFGSLKIEYEAVIQRLEDALIQYQNKNYKLEEENKDLNQQLSALQELLQQVRSINTLQAHRPQYRKMAEMQLLARQRPEPQHAMSQSRREGELGANDDSGKEWQKLMRDIEMISM